MIRAIRRGRERHDGASAVEFALILPILVLFLFGITQFGLAFGRTHGMEAAAREGARMASLGRTIEFSDVEDAAKGTPVPFINNDDIVVEVNGGNAEGWCGTTGDPVRVEVYVSPAAQSKYTISIPMWSGEYSPDYSAEGTFRCEARHASP